MRASHPPAFVLFAVLIAIAFSACDSPLDVNTPRNRYVDRVSTPPVDLVGTPINIVLPPDTSGVDTTVRKTQYCVAFVVDASGSIGNQTTQAFRDGCNELLDSLDGVLDEGAVVYYTQTAVMAQRITTQLPLLRTAVDAIPTTDGGSAMWDGIYLAMLELQSKGSHARKAIVLFTDGNDNASTTGTPTKITALGQSASIELYTIALGLTTHETVLRNMVQAIGGKHYPQPELPQITEICRDVARLLRGP